MAEIEKKEDQPAQEKTESQEPQVENGEGVEGAEQVEEAPKSTKKKKIIIGVLLLALIAGVGVFITVKKQKEKQHAEEAAAAASAENGTAKEAAVFHDLDDMIINLNTEGKSVSFMKIKMTLEVAKKGDLEEVKKMMPKVMDVFQMYMRELRPSDMQGSVGLYRLKEELLLRVNKIVYPAQVNDILFKEVLVQ